MNCHCLIISLVFWKKRGLGWIRKAPAGHLLLSGCLELAWQQPFPILRKKKNGHKGSSISHLVSVSCTTSSPGQVKNEVSVLPPLQGLPSAPGPPSSHPLPASGKVLWHSPAPSTLAVKTQLSDRGKGRQTENNRSDNKRKKNHKKDEHH